MEILSLEDKIQHQSVKEHSSAERVSQSYRHINTLDIVRPFVDMGWNLVSSTEAKVYKRHYLQNFQKHMLIFENDDFTTDEGRLRLVIRNSHDGNSPLELFYGFMRVCCLNQLFVKNLGNGKVLKLTHKGSDAFMERKLQNFIETSITGIEVFKQFMIDYKDVSLTEDQKISFVKSILTLKHRDKAEDILQINDGLVEKILTPLRMEDVGNSAWNVFNVVQEKFTQKGKSVSYVLPSGRNSSLKGLKSIYVVPDFNNNMFQLMKDIVDEIRKNQN